MLETVIKLSAFFGITVEQMISDNPEFNYEYLQQANSFFRKLCSIKLLFIV